METELTSMGYQNIAATILCESPKILDVAHHPRNNLYNDSPEVCVIEAEDIVDTPESDITAIYEEAHNGTCPTSGLLDQENLQITKQGLNCDKAGKKGTLVAEHKPDCKILQVLESEDIDIKFEPENQAKNIVYNGTEKGACNTGGLLDEDKPKINNTACKSPIRLDLNRISIDDTDVLVAEHTPDSKTYVLESEEIDIKFEPENCTNFDTEEEEIDDTPSEPTVVNRVNKELKIMLKDFLVDQQSGSKIMWKTVTIPLKRMCADTKIMWKTVTIPLTQMCVDTVTKQTSLKSRKKKKLSKRKSKKQAKNKNTIQQVFKCDECDFQSFCKKGVILHHTFRHTGQPRRKVDCLYCPKKCNTPKQANFHMWTKHRKEIPGLAEQLDVPLFTCAICKYTTITSTKLNRHMMTHGTFDDTKIHRCSECDYKTPIKDSLNSHFKRHHSEKDVHTCKYCHGNWYCKRELADHLLSQHNDRIEKGLKTIFSVTILHCKLCEFRSVQTRKLHMHMMVKHNDMSKVKTFKCYHCKFEAVRKSVLKTHIASHFPNRYECEYCGERFGEQAVFDLHLLRGHKSYSKDIEQKLKSTVISCKLCDYKTIREINLRNHVKLQHEEGSNTSKYACKLCDFKTHLKRNLITHVRSQHRTKICPLCSKSCRSNSHLGYHISQNHGTTEQGKTLLKTLNFKVYSCKICIDYQSVIAYHFKKHMYKFHNDESSATKSMLIKHNCSQCEYKAYSANRLKNHIRDIHTDEKPFNCSYCKESFKYKQGYAVHLLKNHKRELLRSSKGEGIKRVLGHRVFTCNICNTYQTFHKTTFANHLFFQHDIPRKDECYECDKCGIKMKTKVGLITHLKSHSKRKV